MGIDGSLCVAHNLGMKWSDILSPFTISDLRDATSAPYQTAASWKRRNRLPTRHWYAFLDYAARRGHRLTLDDLAKADSHSEAAA